jgi:HEPN domain-containing protein
MEKAGNYCYALAILVLPFYGALFLSNLAAEQLGQAHLAWAGPTVVPLGLGLLWLVLSQVAAWWFRARLSDKDRNVTLEQLAEQEIAALNRAREMFDSDHYDLSVIEAWKALELRLRRALLMKGITTRSGSPEALIHRATKAGLLSKGALGLLQTLRQQWNIAVSVEPLTREAADSALTAARNILSTIPVEDTATQVKPLL